MILNSTPPAYSSVNEDLIYIAYDANAVDPTKTNYKYVGELWIGGVKVFTSKVFPRPDNNRGLFNFGPVIREYITLKLSPTGSGTAAQTFASGAFFVDVVVKLREEYGGTLGAVVLTDSTRTFFNHYDVNLSAYTDKPVTTRPLSMDLLLTADKYYLPCLATTSPMVIVLAGYTKTIYLPYSNTLQLINISPVAINSEYPGTITAATESYTVVMGGVSYTVNIICEPVYKTYMIHFLNKFGGFESMTFSKVSRKTITSEKKSWQQPAYRVDASGVLSLSENGILHEQTSTFASRYSEKLKISTDLLSDAEYVWLAQLIASPLVYLQDGATVMPVKITNSDYEYRQNINDKLTNLMIDLEFPKLIQTQYR